MDLSWVTTILFLIVIGLIIKYVLYMSSEHGVFKRLGIPSLTPIPVAGNFVREMRIGPLTFQEELYRKFHSEKAYGYYSCKTPILFIRDLDMIRDIAVKHFGTFVNRREFQIDEPLDHMLSMLKDDHWKNVRTTVSPTFSTGKLRRMFHHISSSARTLVEHLREKKDRDQAVELKHVVSCFTMDVIASTGFSVQINSLKEEKSDFVVKAKEIMDTAGRAIFATFFLPFMNKKWDKIGISVFPKGPLQFFSSFVDSALEARKEGANKGLSKTNDFLQLLLESEVENTADNDNMSTEEASELKMSTDRKPLSRTDIQGQAIIFLLAGYDTVSSVMSFTLFLLAENPDCCAKLQQEIDDKLGKRLPTYDNMQDMPYMDMCLNEAMRLYPPGFQLDRVCNQDIEIGGVHIPKGMTVSFPVFAIHRDPAIWTDPMTFNPERFSPENKSDRHPYAHLPFGQGPRNCIGMRLALLEIKVAMSAILQEMTPVTCSESVYPIRLKFFQMVSQDGLWVKMVDRIDF
ncbi:cytochrome P450 3A11 [Elysia marginata]|uniref:Cytochrome P450 3A11 n=1 Tax=Elysia marginata TaxID=1093978 RepID=A0AAV4GWR8_9GAST|nr:cytochrome P450 3A11 [Elysia marginata]